MIDMIASEYNEVLTLLSYEEFFRWKSVHLCNNLVEK